MATSGGVRVTIDQAAIDRLCLSHGGTVYQSMLRLANRVRNNAHGRCPVLTGYLQSHIAVREVDEPGKIQVVDDAEYAIYVHEGTRYVVGRPFLRDALEEEVSRL